MNSSHLKELPHQLDAVLDNFYPDNWSDITSLLKQLKNKTKPSIPSSVEPLKYFAKGTAFITFSYGIDGVSIEMSKYAHTLNEIFAADSPPIHFIGGNFRRQASSVLSPEWQKLQIDGIDGWNKWDNGKWFKALFKKKMKSSSRESDLLAKEIYRQAVLIAKRLGAYFLDNQICLVIPVNIASNPGNLALTLGLVLATEILGIHVLNSNHDFYWESGKPPSKRKPGEPSGVRDHFFRNRKNKPFFSMFKMLYPWNGSRWFQVNINTRQSRRLIKKFGVSPEKVSEISTYIADDFFKTYCKKDVVNIRLRMGHILSNGRPILTPVPIADHLSEIDYWMKNQRPIIVGARPGLLVDPTSEDLIIMLQPTRIIGRKRIERNLELIRALFQKSDLKNAFVDNPTHQLVLHITGPVPKEHLRDLEKVLLAYRETVLALPETFANRIFIAFSVGRRTHASFPAKQFQPLSIDEIFRIADVVVFPSETEGRGLPIIEASASGIPIICSRYRPKKVFREVVGKKLPKDLQIHYTLFPKGKFDKDFLAEVANLLIYRGCQQERIAHNIEAVYARYSQVAFRRKFERLLLQLHQLN